MLRVAQGLALDPNHDFGREASSRLPRPGRAGSAATRTARRRPGMITGIDHWQRDSDGTFKLAQSSADCPFRAGAEHRRDRSRPGAGEKSASIGNQ
jgi:hypothetical protein